MNYQNTSKVLDMSKLDTSKIIDNSRLLESVFLDGKNMPGSYVSQGRLEDKGNLTTSNLGFDE